MLIQMLENMLSCEELVDKTWEFYLKEFVN